MMLGHLSIFIYSIWGASTALRGAERMWSWGEEASGRKKTPREEGSEGSPERFNSPTPENQGSLWQQSNERRYWAPCILSYNIGSIHVLKMGEFKSLKKAKWKHSKTVRAGRPKAPRGLHLKKKKKNEEKWNQ